MTAFMDGYVVLTIVLIAIVAVVAVLEKALDWVALWSRPRPARPDHRIAPDELALTGDDYRDAVADYFARKAERDERRERAIRGH